MQLTDLNKSRDIGANCLLVEIGSFRMLVDAGLHPKRIGNEALPDFSKIEDGSLDFIFLTHCHLDHLGALPVIMRRQPQAQVFLSRPSLLLAPRMLLNCCNVMTRQRDELRIREYPLFQFREAERIGKKCLPFHFGKSRVFRKNGEKIVVTLYMAGHVPGAVGCQVEYKRRKIFFTGDVLFRAQSILAGAQFPKEQVDTLVLETTRGATVRANGYQRKIEIEKFLHAINHTIGEGGSVLIPAFALGRMQEMLAIFHRARREQKLLPCPIYCSGLGLDLVSYLDRIARKKGALSFNRRILTDLNVKPLHAKVKPGKDVKQKGIYLLSSGMLVENTPSSAVAASLLDFPHNAIYYVGYADPDTPGGKLLTCAHDDTFLFEKLNYVARVRAKIEQFDFSGHADREELLAFAKTLNPRAVVLTHGDASARNWFAQELENVVGKVLDPVPGEMYSV